MISVGHECIRLFFDGEGEFIGMAAGAAEMGCVAGAGGAGRFGGGDDAAGGWREDGRDAGLRSGFAGALPVLAGC